MTDDPKVLAAALTTAAYPVYEEIAPAPCSGCRGVTDAGCCRAQVAEDPRPLYPERGYSTGLTDDDLPGMWEHADFE